MKVITEQREVELLSLIQSGGEYAAVVNAESPWVDIQEVLETMGTEKQLEDFDLEFRTAAAALDERSRAAQVLQVEARWSRELAEVAA